MKLAQVDPGGSLQNRPIKSLRHIFLAWRPATNASLRQRVAVLDQILRENPSVGWKLIVLLLPKRPDFGSDGMKPRFREAGASDRQTLTDKLVLEGYHRSFRIRGRGTLPQNAGHFERLDLENS